MYTLPYTCPVILGVQRVGQEEQCGRQPGPQPARHGPGVRQAEVL